MIRNSLLRNHFLKPSHKILYIILESYCWNQNYCFPAQEKLAKPMGVKPRTVRRWLIELQEFGLIDIIYRFDDSNIYILNDYEEFEECHGNAIGKSQLQEDDIPDDLKCPDKNTHLINTQSLKDMSIASTTTSGKDSKTTKKILTDSQGREIIKATRDKSSPHFKYPVQFLEFWEQYPKKESKKKAYNCWEKLVFREKIRTEDLTASAKNFKRHCRDTGQPMQYIKHPSTYLGPGEFWLDYLEADDKANFHSKAKRETQTQTRSTRLDQARNNTRELDPETARILEAIYNQEANKKKVAGN